MGHPFEIPDGVLSVPSEELAELMQERAGVCKDPLAVQLLERGADNIIELNKARRKMIRYLAGSAAENWGMRQVSIYVLLPIAPLVMWAPKLSDTLRLTGVVVLDAVAIAAFAIVPEIVKRRALRRHDASKKVKPKAEPEASQV